MKRVPALSRAVFLLFVFGLQGCVSWFYTPGKSELKALCEKDGGMPTYQKVEVEGYYNDFYKRCRGGCVDEVLFGGFKFLEVNLVDPKSYWVLNQSGVWRITKVPRHTGHCHAGIEKIMEKKRGSKRYDNATENHCIRAQKVESKKSRYLLYSKSKEWEVSEYYGSTIARIEEYLVDSHTNQKVVRRVNYLLNPWPHGSNYGKVYSCSSVIPEIEYKSMIYPTSN